MKLTPTRHATANWALMHGGRQVALLYLDHLEQIDTVVLCPETSDTEQLQALRLAASHVASYVVRREQSTLGGLAIVTHSGTISEAQSTEILRDGSILDGVAEMDADKLTQALHQIGVDVVSACTMTLKASLETVLSNEQLRALPVSFELGTQRWLHDWLQPVTFKVGKPAQFRAWNGVGKPHPRESFDLYIVPAYHPDMTDKTSAGMVNGNTDALIGGKAVRAVYAPKGSTTSSKEWFSGSWASANHPFYAAGQEIVVGVSQTKALSAEGIEEIRKLLFALLELEDTYLSINGGFNGPNELLQNVAHRTDVRISTRDGKARGSEGFCVWAYRVLEEEGELNAAYVPSWLNSEGWVEAYSTVGSSRS